MTSTHNPDNLLKKAPFAFAWHKVITDEQGNPVDYVFLEVNEAYERMTGLKASRIINKRATEALPELVNNSFDWISFFGQVALTGESKTFEQYVDSLKRWYRGEVTSTEKGYFSVMFTDISKEKLIAETTRYFLHREKDNQLPYQKLCDGLLQICNARYVAMNIFGEYEKDFSTVAISGVKSQLKKAATILGFPVTGKKWAFDPDREEKLEGKVLARFNRLSDLTGEVIAPKVSSLIEKTFDIGEVVVVKIMKEEMVLGDFTIFMPKGEHLVNEGLVELFAGQTALLFEKYRAEQELEDFFSLNLDLLCIADTEGNFIKINNSWSDILGYSTKELYKRKFLDFVHPEDMQSTLDAIARLSAHEKVFNFINRYRCKDGAYRYFEWQSYPRGKRIYAAARDITSRIRQEEELRTSELRFRSLFNQRHDAVFWLDLTGKCIAANNRATEMTGYTEEELKNLSANELSAEPGLSHNVMQRILNGEIVPAYERRFRTKEGKIINVEINAELIRDSKGIPMHIHSVVRNITARKIAEEQILKSQQMLQSVLQSQRELICRYKPDTTITFANKAYADFTGLKQKDLIGSKWIDVIPAVRREESMVRIQALLENKSQPYVYEKESFDSKGILKWHAWTDYSILNAEGDIDEIQSVGYDITDRIEKERLQKEMEVSNKTLKFKQNFLASLSHEMRTPLSGIMGIAKELDRSLKDEQQKGYINLLSQSADNLAFIIDQVLDYSDLESGKAQLKPDRYSLRDCIDQSLEFFMGINSKPIGITDHIEESLPEKLIFDKKRVCQVLNNLLMNAVKFTEKGHVGISIREEECDDLQDNEIMLRFEVADTGIGISEAQQKLLFLPFSQVQHIETEKYRGMGLGLALSKEVVELHGGTIGVTSQEGKGSTFGFTIKALSPTLSGNDIAEEMQKKITGLRILFVEDKLLAQKLVKLTLSSLGHSVSLASNGQEALQNYNITDFDLILMDIQMPVMDGLTATRKIREKYSNPPPIVGLSANSFEGARENYMKQGMDDFLNKPLNVEDFNKVLESLDFQSK